MANKKCKGVFQLSPDNESSEPTPDMLQDRVSLTELKKIWNDRMLPIPMRNSTASGKDYIS